MATGFKHIAWNAAACALGGVLLLLYLVQRDAAQRLAIEDGIVEWATAICYLVASVLFLTAARRHGFRSVWLLGLALLCFAVAGEEISWGQRVFGVATPTSLAANNVQEEMNLHNLDGIHQHVRLVGASIVGVLFFVIPVTDAAIESIHRLYRRLRIPVFPLRLMLIPLVGLLFMVVPRVAFTSTIFTVDEFGEIVLSMAFLAYAVTSVREPFNDHRQPGDGPVDASSAEPQPSRPSGSRV